VAVAERDDLSASDPYAMPGFPEWLPGDVQIEQHLISVIRSGFERFGFQPVDLAAVQPWEVLVSGDAQYSDGGIAKPIFDVAEPVETATGGKFGLRYDLTVPLARFIANRSSGLDFPLHTYQINKVWRAEQPTPSHWREFYQCDVDVIGRGELSLMHDAEIACALNAAFDTIGVAGFTVRISNRRVLAALLAAHGIRQDRTRAIVHIIDEGGRQPAAQTVEQLRASGVPGAAAGDLGLLLGCATTDDARVLLHKRQADTSGLDELDEVMAAALAMGMPDDRLCLDFSITRGHDYYTGTVYETFASGREHWGALGSGGRYANLLEHILGSAHPGVGVSIGLTRLLGLVRQEQSFVARLRGSGPVLVVTTTESGQSYAVAAARGLREAGIPVRVVFDVTADEEAVRMAARIGAAVLLTTVDDGHDGDLMVRHLSTGEQSVVRLSDVVTTVGAPVRLS
jgi:histidyl-tRNA synthetase